MVTWRELIVDAERRLAEAGVAESESQAKWIGRQATGTDAGQWIDTADQEPTVRQLAYFDGMIERRSAGEPLQYVLGNWGFRTLELFVDRRVLIPRPETEIVAEWALKEVRRLADDVATPTVVDLGTGSGAIGLSLAVEHRGTEVWLTDASPDALAVAQANIAGIGWSGSTVTVAEGDWFAALPPALRGRLDVAVSNPPYVADGDDLEPQVADWEPRQALVAGDNGTAHLRHLLTEGPKWLQPAGALVLEMAPAQVPIIAAQATEYFADVEPFQDLAERARGIVARRPISPADRPQR